MSQEKIKAGVLGCTGAVGQKLIALLDKHPLFEVTEIAASERSAGKVFEEAVNWLEPNDIPENIAGMKIKNCLPDLGCKILFSGLDSKVAGEIESTMAENGYAVVSNSRNHRMFDNVPLIIPEINADHYKLIEAQKQNNKKGFIVTNPNCSTIVLCLSLYPIYKSFGLKKVMVTTMQAISGAGYPGVPSLDILGNVIPHIPDEEAKMETETLKIFGNYENGKINFADFKISAMCNRVPVRDGHTISVSFETEKKASGMEILNSLDEYNSEFLKDTGIDVIRYFEDPFRPQPLLDAGKGNGMTVSAGNLRECGVLDWKYTALGHNTIRGAAGAAIINAEYLVKKGLI
ncbi:MAG TPA: aspartate-semialdehyde dehydrogenase [Ignavibacteria bacterium]|nr:aspartate-semialdehyde dehydrogenase [Ignavibacteria bacterium]HMR40935.1 aspartate-semialdehyde dehydrogenase [Ignavibacteria bacterium]